MRIDQDSISEAAIKIMMPNYNNFPKHFCANGGFGSI